MKTLVKITGIIILLAVNQHLTFATNNIPSGTAVSIQLDRALSSNGTQAGTQFGGTVDFDVLADNKIIIPAGTRVMGQVISTTTAGRLAGRADVTLKLTKIQRGDEYVDIASSALVVSASEGQGRRTARNVAVGAGVGAVYNGGKGAGRGAATMGAVSLLGGDGNITIPQGYNLQFELIQNLEY